MLNITNEFKAEALKQLLEQRQNFTGSDAAFAKQWNLNSAVFSRLKNGETANLIRDTQWLSIGRELGMSLNEKKLKTTRTDVLTLIEEDVTFCQQYAKSRMFIDDSEIGKTIAARYLSKTLKNCFYVDASQAKTKQLFVRLIAKTIGIDHDGKYADVKANIKYYLKMLPNPMVIIDEAGDLEYKAFLEIKEFWNATENACGWYLIGADSLLALFEKGIRNKKVGFRETFSRFSSSFTKATPNNLPEKVTFYRKLITDVLKGNEVPQAKIDVVVKACLRQDESGNISGLRRAESLLILNS